MFSIRHNSLSCNKNINDGFWLKLAPTLPWNAHRTVLCTNLRFSVDRKADISKTAAFSARMPHLPDLPHNRRDTPLKTQRKSDIPFYRCCSRKKPFKESIVMFQGNADAVIFDRQNCISTFLCCTQSSLLAIAVALSILKEVYQRLSHQYARCRKNSSPLLKR